MFERGGLCQKICQLLNRNLAEGCSGYNGYACVYVYVCVCVCVCMCVCVWGGGCGNKEIKIKITKLHFIILSKTFNIYNFRYSEMIVI